jgi:hypothetical protein
VEVVVSVQWETQGAGFVFRQGIYLLVQINGSRLAGLVVLNGCFFK